MMLTPLYEIFYTFAFGMNLMCLRYEFEIEDFCAYSIFYAYAYAKASS